MCQCVKFVGVAHLDFTPFQIHIYACTQEDFMKAARKMMDAKKLEGTQEYDKV